MLLLEGTQRPRANACSQVEQQSGILSSFDILTPTGCTPQFSQFSRMNRPLEPRVGENRLIDIIKAEASAFLYEMKAEGLFKSEEKFLDRLGAVLDEIQNGAVATQVRRANLESDEMTTVKIDGISTRDGYRALERLNGASGMHGETRGNASGVLFTKS
jgi:hypothetical protein